MWFIQWIAITFAIVTIALLLILTIATLALFFWAMFHS